MSARVRETCEATLGPGNCRWFDRVDDSALVRLFRESQYFIHLGLDEGFGMPYVEALCAGCIVIAVDLPLTQELLGESAVLLPESAAAEMAEALDQAAEPTSELRRRRATEFSWPKFAAAVRSELMAVR